jgi:hypothetical protein
MTSLYLNKLSSPLPQQEIVQWQAKVTDSFGLPLCLSGAWSPSQIEKINWDIKVLSEHGTRQW